MRDDPLDGVVVDAAGRPFCPTCGLDLRGGVCPACDPARVTTPSAKRARSAAERERQAVAVGLTRTDGWWRNPLLWVAAIVLVAMTPAWLVPLGGAAAWLAAWRWWARRKVRG